jgi:hypothetical protein
MDREKILNAIRKIVGSKMFEFSDAYVKQNGNTPTIGNNGIHYGRLTRTYLYVPCWGRYEYDEEEEMYGWHFCKLPVMRYANGQSIKKVPLEEMFTRDLKKVLDDLTFYYWGEKNVDCQNLNKSITNVRQLLIKEKSLKNFS